MNDRIIVVGAGMTGSVAARVLAEAGRAVEVWEKRTIGGAAGDYRHPGGAYVHIHGPHIFHTNIERVYDFLRRFTEWIPYTHRVLGKIGATFCPIPFNFTSIERCFDADTAETLKNKLASGYGEGQAVTIGRLLESSDAGLAGLADFVYRNVFLNYTKKQWGMSPQELGGNVMDRVPVRVSYDDRYFTDRYQGIPKDGYTEMIRRMLDHPNIDLKLNCDARTRLSIDDGSICIDDRPFNGKVIYTGCVAELMKYRFGFLPYRTLRFETALEHRPFQPAAVVNYPNDHEYTRVTEFAHFYPDAGDDEGIVMYEYPLSYEPGSGREPYYPIPLVQNDLIYRRYADFVSGIGGFYPAGRLGGYRYINMDIAVESGMEAAEEVLRVVGAH